ncbi:hypothetical protein H1P_1070011 [Hyella patelloides LEGE 07179]|uniref:Uncharacterized protein n=1 Tax=Hyella patelloides LEGE 07179 TaxID=945734 RepID=A0A563VJB5_9CYAN|nr:hypothetical protein H1P_1070011 [Hyella patelloides LEGE 07179]
MPIALTRIEECSLNASKLKYHITSWLAVGSFRASVFTRFVVFNINTKKIEACGRVYRLSL